VAAESDADAVEKAFNDELVRAVARVESCAAASPPSG
jgi:hypothetical protein